MAVAEGRLPIKQMYDEQGNPFYPLTHIDAITGTEEQKRGLATLGTTTRNVDLSMYLMSPFVGTFDLDILNDFIYFYSGRISYTTDGASVEVDKDIIVAQDIPALYRSKVQIIHCTAIGGPTDRVTCWIDEFGKLIMRVTPKYMNKPEDFQKEYRSSVLGLDFSGLLIKSGLEDDIYGDHNKAVI